MSIANKVCAFLDKSHIDYQLLKHRPSQNSLSSAIQSNIATSQIAKAVILSDLQNRKLMAILPATHKISLSAINESYDRQFHIMKESHIYELFDDCEHGAVPPLAQPYHMERVYDLLLLEQPQIYLEAGDHQSLIKLTQKEFGKLMLGAKSLHFSHQLFH
jgi:Ala-tRNA(Pro) deacylase